MYICTCIRKSCFPKAIRELKSFRKPDLPNEFKKDCVLNAKHGRELNLLSKIYEHLHVTTTRKDGDGYKNVKLNFGTTFLFWLFISNNTFSKETS